MSELRLPKMLVVTSCTGEKLHKVEVQLRLEDFEDQDRLKERENTLADFLCPASEMYIGLQHLRVMEGIQLLRNSLGKHSVELAILSAGYGFISENQRIAPYEATFSGMKSEQVDKWGQSLELNKNFESLIQDYELVFVLLGNSYLRALSLPVRTFPGQTFIYLTSKSSSQYVPPTDAKTGLMYLSNAEAKHYGYGLVGLKGYLFKRFAEVAARQPLLLNSVHATPDLFLNLVDRDVTQLEISLSLPQTTKKPAAPARKRSSPSQFKALDKETHIIKDEYLEIPNLPPAPNLHLGMQYFIPEWDDRVDPNYNFLTDKSVEGRDPYMNDVYSHELYPHPNYDGILVSKVKVEESKKKRACIEVDGIHKFIRFNGPVMGDCGAFGYIGEDVPPFQTDEILQYYQNLGFDLGVSIDHLIVGPFSEPGVREHRYKLTLNNAQEFLEKHRAGGYTFTPMGAIQGWSPESYANAAKEVIAMGYDYIAIGGVARTPSKEIIEILKAMQTHLNSQTRVHLFGVARMSAIPVFRHLGVTSFDSASALRRAWLGSGANYHTTEGKMYTALRVPPVEGHGVRIRRLIEAGVASPQTLQALEKDALAALRDYDKGALSLETTLETVLAYDELLELPRDGVVDPTSQPKRRAKHKIMYTELLADQPWKYCECPICQAVGVEVAIFRGNNRNRRRGFHNTYAFYKRFQAFLEVQKHMVKQ
jgi:Queuine tRNA-ribosyltransferase